MEVLLYALLVLFPIYHAYRVTIVTQAAVKYLNVKIGVFTTLTPKKAKITKIITFLFCSSVSIVGVWSLTHLLLGDNALPFFILFGTFFGWMNYWIIFLVDWNPSFARYQ